MTPEKFISPTTQYECPTKAIVTIHGTNYVEVTAGSGSSASLAVAQVLIEYPNGESFFNYAFPSGEKLTLNIGDKITVSPSGDGDAFLTGIELLEDGDPSPGSVTAVVSTITLKEEGSYVGPFYQDLRPPLDSNGFTDYSLTIGSLSNWPSNEALIENANIQTAVFTPTVMVGNRIGSEQGVVVDIGFNGTNFIKTEFNYPDPDYYPEQKYRYPVTAIGSFQADTETGPYTYTVDMVAKYGLTQRSDFKVPETYSPINKIDFGHKYPFLQIGALNIFDISPLVMFYGYHFMYDDKATLTLNSSGVVIATTTSNYWGIPDDKFTKNNKIIGLDRNLVVFEDGGAQYMNPAAGRYISNNKFTSPLGGTNYGLMAYLSYIDSGGSTYSSFLRVKTTFGSKRHLSILSHYYDPAKSLQFFGSSGKETLISPDLIGDPSLDSFYSINQTASQYCKMPLQFIYIDKYPDPNLKTPGDLFNEYPEYTGTIDIPAPFGGTPLTIPPIVYMDDIRTELYDTEPFGAFVLEKYLPLPGLPSPGFIGIGVGSTENGRPIAVSYELIASPYDQRGYRKIHDLSSLLGTGEDSKIYSIGISTQDKTRVICISKGGIVISASITDTSVWRVESNISSLTKGRVVRAISPQTESSAVYTNTQFAVGDNGLILRRSQGATVWESVEITPKVSNISNIDITVCDVISGTDGGRYHILAGTSGFIAAIED